MVLAIYSTYCCQDGVKVVGCILMVTLSKENTLSRDSNKVSTNPVGQTTREEL